MTNDEARATIDEVLSGLEAIDQSVKYEDVRLMQVSLLRFRDEWLRTHCPPDMKYVAVRTCHRCDWVYESGPYPTLDMANQEADEAEAAHRRETE